MLLLVLSYVKDDNFPTSLLINIYKNAMGINADASQGTCSWLIFAYT